MPAHARTHTVPALMPLVSACTWSRLEAHTAEARPYSVALERWMTCARAGGAAASG